MNRMLPYLLPALVFSSVAAADTPKELLQRAVAAVEAGDTKKALELSTQAAKAAPRDADIQNGLGIITMAIGRTEAARNAFERALKLAPQHDDALYNLAKLYMDVGRPKDAIPLFKRLAKRRPDDAGPRLELAMALAGAEKLNDADAILAKDPSPVALSLRSFVAIRAGKWSAALTHATAALRAEPNSLRHRLTLAMAQIHAGQREAAVRSLKQLIRQAPASQANVPYGLALAAFLSGDATGAREWLSEASSRAPDMFKGSPDPMAFPTPNDRAFLAWAAAHPGLPRAPEPHIQELTIVPVKASGRGCEHSGPFMASLLSRAARLGACLPPKTPLSVTARADKQLSQVLVTPRGKPAGCIQAALADLTVALPRGARCTVSFKLKSAR